MVGMDNMLDLTYLTESERKWISEVLERDEEIQKREDARIERLKSKAMRTNNPTIRKKINMRTGQWFLDLADKDKNFKNRGVDTVRASIRRKGKDRPKPASPVATQITELVEKDENKYEEGVNNGAQEEEISYFSQVHRNYGDEASGDESYENEELRNQDKVEELSSAVQFLKTVDKDQTDLHLPIIKCTKEILEIIDTFRHSECSCIGRQLSLEFEKSSDENAVLKKVLKMMSHPEDAESPVYSEISENEMKLVTMKQINQSEALKPAPVKHDESCDQFRPILEALLISDKKEPENFENETSFSSKTAHNPTVTAILPNKISSSNRIK